MIWFYVKIILALPLLGALLIMFVALGRSVLQRGRKPGAGSEEPGARADEEAREEE